MQLHLIRHGPKNNDPQAHQTGVEALLDPSKTYKIIGHAYNLLASMGPSQVSRIRVETTPINRAVATGTVLQGVMSYDPRFDVPKLVVNELIGSSGIHPETGEAVNLSPRAMSNIWSGAKEEESYKGQQGENRPLYAWCEQGFDNPQTGNPEDPGISLREIACRVGAYTHETLTSSDPRDVVVAIGHSGDIEPFIYLALEMLEGRDGTAPDALTRHFDTTGGALEPLDGITFDVNLSGDLRLYYPITDSKYKDLETLPLDILKKQAGWFKDHGKSQQVLEQRLKLLAS